MAESKRIYKEALLTVYIKTKRKPYKQNVKRFLTLDNTLYILECSLQQMLSALTAFAVIEIRKLMRFLDCPPDTRVLVSKG